MLNCTTLPKVNSIKKRQIQCRQFAFHSFVALLLVLVGSGKWAVFISKIIVLGEKRDRKSKMRKNICILNDL